MDMMPYEDFDLLEQRVREMVRSHVLPPEVRRVGVTFGDLHDGDPAVWVELYLRDDYDPGPNAGSMWADVKMTLAQGAREIVPGRSAAVRILLDHQGLG